MLIEKIQAPADLKSLRPEELRSLAEELRALIIERVSLNGGHLSSNLGVVELSIAIHYVFNSPVDKIIWDVGHQSYAHKLLTGRYRVFHTLRTAGGIAGFPRMIESSHDAFGTGHSSTSISAGLGIAEARDRKGEHFKVIVVIGDGAMTAGLAFEGLNQAGHLRKDLIVILNDNEMSISPNVGALSNYLSKVLTGTFYKKLKRETKAILGGIPRIGESVAKIAEKAEGSIKGFFLPGGLFVDLGFNYIGPIDGHDIPLLLRTFESLKDMNEPTLVHIVTKKGKGYKFSEEDPCVYHGVGPFTVDTGLKPEPPFDQKGNGDRSDPCAADICISYGDAFGEALVEFASRDWRIVAITAAMREGTGLTRFAERFPSRFYDVGIAEPHAVTFAAGLATQGLRPVVAIYSTFLQRAYDEIVHDVCLQRLPVILAVDRAGIVGEDGATHQGLFDVSYLRNIPHLVFMAPKDGDELRDMLSFALDRGGPVAIRYPRGKAKPVAGLAAVRVPVELGKAEMLLDGDDVAIIALGPTVIPALAAAAVLRAEGTSTAVVNARFIKPLDEEMIVGLCEKVRRVVTVEENVLTGGFGSAVLECVNRANLPGVTIKCIGIADQFVEHGSQAYLRKVWGVDATGIYQSVRSLVGVLIR